jgi:hypothetical protein
MSQEKVAKALGRDTVEEMDAMREDELKKVIVEATGAMKQVKEELEDNRNYQAAKQDMKDLSAGKRDVDKRQKARIAYALDRLQAFGQMDASQYNDWEKTRAQLLKDIAARKKQEIEDGAALAGVKVTVESHMEEYEE